MKRPITRRIFSLLVFAAFVIAVMSSNVSAFCPMCRTVIEGASGAEQAANSFSLAALILLAPPVVIFAALFGLFYRLRHASGDSPLMNDEKGDRAPARALTR